MLLNIKKNKNFNLPIPFNESVGIETANYFKNLPIDIEELIVGIAGCSPYLRKLLIIHKSWLCESILTDEFDIISEINDYYSKGNDVVVKKDSYKFEDVSNHSFSKNIDMQLSRVFSISKLVLSHMKEEKNGSIVNIASIYGEVANDFRIYEKTNITYHLFYDVRFSVINS